MGRKRDRKQSNAVLGGGAGGRRVKLDLWTPDPIAEARKAREAASAPAPAEAQEAAAEDRSPGAPSDNGEVTRRGPKPAETAPSGLGHLIGAYSEDDEDDASPQEEAAAQAGAPGEDVDDKVKSFLAELETDGLLEEGEEAAPEEDPTRQAEGSAPDLDPVGVAPGEEGQTAGPAVAGEGDRRDGGGEEEFVEEVWQAILDPDSGEHYYWNTQTLETTWDKPRTIKRRRAGNLARASPDEREGGSAVTGHVESGEAGQGSEAEEHLRGGATQPESPCPIETGGEEASEAGPKFGKKESRPLEEPRTGEGADILNAEPSEEDALQAERSSLAIDGGAAPQARSSDDEMLALANQKKVVEAGASSDEASDSGDASEASDSEDRMEANGRAAGAGEAGLRAGEKASAETKQREQEPVGDPGSTLWDERRANEEPSSEQKVLVSGLLEEGEAQVRRLRERAGPSLAHVSPLARLAIQAEAVSALARKLQTADSVNTVWARICEQLLLLSAHATEAEGIVEDGYGIDRTDGGGREPQGGSDEQHTDEEIEALLDVRPSGAEGAGDWEGRPQSSRATGARLFPIPDASRSLAKGEAGEERKNAEEPQNGLAQPGSREERAPSKAELLQKKTADLQKRIAAIQAFKTPASEPPAEATALVGLAGYGSEMEDGEIAPSDDFPTSEGARPASRSGRSEEPSGEDDMDVDDIEGAPETGRSDLSAGSRQRQWRGAMGASPGKKATALSASRGDTKAAGVGGPEPLRSTLQQLLALGASPYEQMGYGVTGGAELDFAPPSRAAANPAATVSTPPSHLAYSYPTPPPMPYGGTEAAPEPPSYDPFAEAHPPPPPASPPPEDTWQAQPPPPSEEVSLLEPQPPPHVIEAAVVPTVEVQGPVLSAPPVRLARPPEAVPKAEQPKSVAEAAAAAAAAAGASRKGKPKKPASAPVGRGLSSAKKVSSLMDKWKAAAQDGQPRKEGPLSAEELERQKAAELEEWRRQQIASGDADKNANFAPIEGDWRKRVKKAQKQAEREARHAAAASASPRPRDKPDLAALAKGLPPGWQPFLDSSSGDVYYGNLQSSETTWTRPAG